MSTSFVGLYYPYINFRDEGWLKISALYCDGMTRIVPPQVLPRESYTVSALTDAGFMRAPIPPDYADPDAASGLFMDLIAQHGDDLLSAGFGVESSESWPDDTYTMRYGKS